MLSGVKPRFSMTTSPGAETPERSMNTEASA
jgi:hypothetical protein